MWILVTHKNHLYENKILEVKEDWCADIYDGTVVWFIKSVNGEIREEPDFFELSEFKNLKYTIVDERALKLLAFI